jgi:hypothetical protein
VKGLLPTPVQGLPSSIEMIQIDAAGNHCISLSKAGRVFTWGDGREGQLGFSIANSTSKCISLQDLYSNKPRLVADLDFVAVAASHTYHSDNNKVLTADGNTAPVLSAAQLLAKTPKITSVYTSETGSAALSSSGHVYCWGSNDVGQLGIPMPRDIPHENSTDTTGPDHCSAARHVVSRHLHMQTFDSNHNVILPMRLECVDKYFIRSLFMGPNHMICFGTERSAEEKSIIVGKTLHEAQLDHEQSLVDIEETTVNPYGKGILHKPIATGILGCSLLAEKDATQPRNDSTNQSLSDAAIETSKFITVDANDLSCANERSKVSDSTSITTNATASNNVETTHSSSPTASPPIVTSLSNPVTAKETDSTPHLPKKISSNASINTTTAESIMNVKDTSSIGSKLWQLSNNDKTISHAKHDRVGRRRFSFGFFARRSSSSLLQQPQRRSVRSRHKDGKVSAKDDNEPSNGTV